MSAIMSGYVSQAALGSTWAGHVGYLPLNRVIQTDREGRPNGKYSNTQRHHFLHLLPKGLRTPPYQRATTYRRRFTTTTTPTTTTTTTTPTPNTSRMPRFHYVPLESRQDPGDAASTAPEDDAIVFLVGIFNLMAIVVYTANKYLAGTRAGDLSERMIQWQVQKVLDELVLKVHSSQYAAELLSRAMPDDAPPMARSLSVYRRNGGRSSSNRSHEDVSQGIAGLRKHLHSSSSLKTTHDQTETWKGRWGAWLHLTRNLLPALLSRSQVLSLSTVRLNPQIYVPIWHLYSSLLTEDLAQTLQDMTGSPRGEDDHNGRAFASSVNMDSLLSALTQLDMKQVRSILSAFTTLGRAHQRVDILSLLLDTLKEIPKTRESLGQARVISEADSFTSTFMSKLTSALKSPSTHSSRRQPKPMEYESTTSRSPPKNMKGTTPTWVPPYRRLDSAAGGEVSIAAPQQLRRRMGTVEDDHEVASENSHWTDRWFSLLTLASPVGLDMTTLYAKARSNPECLRGLLCRANKAWRKIGPVQAALTPFSSVVLSWALEDKAPHSLGDSLIAIRAGWMDKDCQHLYPECPQISKAHPAAKEAISFFSRLHRVATQPTTTPRPTKAFYTQESTTMSSVPYTKESDHVTQGQRLPSQIKHHPTTMNNMNSTDRESLALQAFYDRYGGEGPMSVPGNMFLSTNYKSQDKYAKGDNSEAFENSQRRKDTMIIQKPKLLYEKYDSPSTNKSDNAGSRISVSNSVSGMALQDRPTTVTKPPWRRLFHHNDGAKVPSSRQHDSKNHNDTFHQEQRQPAIFSLPAYSAYMASTFTNKRGPHSFNSIGLKHKPKENNRPMFPNTRKRLPLHQTSTSFPASSPTSETVASPPTKYKYGLRRGLPAVNVAGYGSYNMGYNRGDGELYQHLKPWYTHRPQPLYPSAQASRSTSPAPTASTIFPIILTTTTPDPLAFKDVAPFGPEDAVTDVLRNELLFEYVRDQKKSSSQEENRSL